MSKFNRKFRRQLGKNKLEWLIDDLTAKNYNLAKAVELLQTENAMLNEELEREEKDET